MIEDKIEKYLNESKDLTSQEKEGLDALIKYKESQLKIYGNRYDPFSYIETWATGIKRTPQETKKLLDTLEKKGYATAITAKIMIPAGKKKDFSSGSFKISKKRYSVRWEKR